MKRPLSLAVLVLAAIVLMGCGGKVIDHQKAEEFIRLDLTEAGVEVEAVSCPGDVEVAAGVDFNCEVTADGGEEAVVQMRILDDEGRVKPIKIESAEQDS